MNKHENLKLFMDCKDHSISKEEFQLFYDTIHDMLITLPKPNDLDTYYDSDDYISHTDAKRSVLEKMYHYIKAYSLKKKVRLISKLNNGSGKLLDIGAGTGDFLMTAKSNDWNVTGTEPNHQARKLAQEKQVILDTQTNNYKDTSFDVITMWHVLEHVVDLDVQIAELQRLLKPQGHLIIAVPNYKSYDAKYYKSFWAAYDVPRHLWHFSKKSIYSLFKNNDFVVSKVLPMKFDSFYVSLLSEKYKTGKMNFFKAFWIGFLSNLKGSISKEYSSHIYVLKKM